MEPVRHICQNLQKNGSAKRRNCRFMGTGCSSVLELMWWFENPQQIRIVGHGSRIPFNGTLPNVRDSVKFKARGRKRILGSTLHAQRLQGEWFNSTKSLHASGESPELYDKKKGRNSDRQHHIPLKIASLSRQHLIPDTKRANSQVYEENADRLIVFTLVDSNALIDWPCSLTDRGFIGKLIVQSVIDSSNSKPLYPVRPLNHDICMSVRRVGWTEGREPERVGMATDGGVLEAILVIILRVSESGKDNVAQMALFHLYSKVVPTETSSRCLMVLRDIIGPIRAGNAKDFSNQGKIENGKNVDHNSYADKRLKPLEIEVGDPRVTEGISMEWE
ncbi:hypothetical protein Tco_1403968 [Tanacetum coccineum]